MTKFLKILLILSFASLVCFAQTRQGSTNQTVTNSDQAKPNSTTKNIVELNQRGAGKKIGTVTVTETANGVSIDLEAKGLALESGVAELHLYVSNSPQATETAEANSFSGGGLGEDISDLGALIVNADGSISQTVVSDGIKVSDIEGKALVITDEVDNYANSLAEGIKEPLYIASF